MSKQAEQAMNNMTIHELRTLYVSCGLVTITGNGQGCAIVPQKDSEKAERMRTDYGY